MPEPCASRAFSCRAASSLLVGTLIVICGSQPLPGQSSVTKMLPFRQLETDPGKSYELTEQNGPWMILAASFAGDNAEQQARQLVLELRQQRMAAYTHRKRYDFSQSVQGLGLNRYGEPKKMRYQTPAAFDEIAVLVGDYPSINDPGLEKTLQVIKYSQPKSLAADGGSTRRFAAFREQIRNYGKREQDRVKGPMGSAFVTRNPLLPKEYFVPTGVDKLVQQMNREVDHSLLDCPGKYTVRVATFRGNVIIDQKKIQEIEQSGRMSSKLAEAGEKAHLLTEALRKRGVEAYEFHDRHESIVTIGSFNSLGTPRHDGRTEINPAILKIINTYSAKQQQLPGQSMAGLVPVSLNGISFDVQPTAVEVPKRSVAKDYARS